MDWEEPWDVSFEGCTFEDNGTLATLPLVFFNVTNDFAGDPNPVAFTACAFTDNVGGIEANDLDIDQTSFQGNTGEADLNPSWDAPYGATDPVATFRVTNSTFTDGTTAIDLAGDGVDVDVSIQESPAPPSAGTETGSTSPSRAATSATTRTPPSVPCTTTTRTT